MSRALGIIACLVIFAVGPACGGSSKKSKTTPGTKVADKGGKDAKSIEDLDPNAPADKKDPDAKTGDGDKGDGDKTGNGDKGDGDKGDGDKGDGDKADNTPKPPPIKPPNLDLSPEQARKKVKAHLQKAHQYLNSDPNVTIVEAKAALKWAPRSIEAVVLLAQAYYNKRQYDTAEVLLALVLRDHTKKPLAEKNADFFFTQGLIYDRTERPKSATKAYRRAVAINGRHAKARINLGAALLANKAYPDAVTQLEYAVNTLGVKTAITWNLLGAAYRGRAASAGNSTSARNGFLRKAETAFKRSIQKNKSYAPVHYNLGVLYLDAEKFPLGSGTMDKLVRLERSKSYFEEYLKLSGADVKLAEKRLKQLKRYIRREKKKRARAKKKKGSS
jgi:Tfp pilus assembly protein PilF